MSARSGALERTLPFGLIVLSVCGFQLGAAIAKPLFATIGAQGASALRLGLAALILSAAVRPWRFAVPKAVRGSLLLFGLALAGLNLFFFMAIRTVPLGLTVAIEFLGPLTLVLLDSRRALDFLWAAIAVAGLVVLLPWPGSETSLDPTGIGFAMLSACCWIGYIVFGRRTSVAIPGSAATALGVAVAALAVVPIGIGHAGSELLRWEVWPIGLLVAVVSGSLPYFFELTAMRRVPPRVFGVLTSLEPAFGCLFGYLLLGQHLTAVQGAAIAAVIAASLGSTLSHPTPQKAPERFDPHAL